MAGNKTVYTLDLDTSKLISKYRDAISQMEKAGVSGDITKGLTQGLEKLAKEYQNLERSGKAGFTNSKQIENFQKRVEKLMTSFRGFESELGGVSKKIEDVAKKSSEVNKKLSSAFSKFGFKDVAKQMDEINRATDKEAKLGEIVKAELEARAKAVADLKAKYEEAAKAAAEATAKTTTNKGLASTVKSQTGKNMYTTGQFKPDSSTKDAIEAQAKAIAKAAKDGEAAWAEFSNYLKTNGLDKVFNKNAMAGVEQVIKDMQADFQAAEPAIEAADRALEELNAAEESFNQLGKNTKNGLVANREAMAQFRNGVNEVTEAVEQRSNVMENADADFDELNNAINQTSAAYRDVSGAANQAEGAFDRSANAALYTAEKTESAAKSFENLKNNILRFFSIGTIFNGIKKSISQTYQEVQKLDKSFASIAMVTNKSVGEMWESYDKYNEMAVKLGQSTDSMIQASALFYQQGLDTNEALALTEDTMKLATLAGNDFATATQEMTSAIRGFKMEMNEGGRVADVYSNLAAHAAATVDDIAQAMARTASIANSAGMSFENTSAFLAQMIETTQESAENIGTSLKTIIARFTELKENVAGTADSEFEDLDYNKVDKALKSVGVSLKDTTGQFRNLDEVFLELSQKWDSLDRNTQRYVATIAAGSRQQSRFIAMMDNYDRTIELMDYASNSAGKADEQFAKNADTIEYKLNAVKEKWAAFRQEILDSDFFKGLLDGLSDFLDRLKNIDLKKAIMVAPFAVWAAKTFIMNFLNTLKTGMGALQKVGQTIGQKINAGINSALKNLSKKHAWIAKIGVQVDPRQAEAQYALALERMKKLTEQAGNEFVIHAAIDSAPFGIAEQSVEHFGQKMIELTGDVENANEYLAQFGVRLDESGNIAQGSASQVDQAASAINKLGQSGQKATIGLQKAEQQMAKTQMSSQMASMAFQGVATSLTMAFSAMLSGAADIEEVGDMIIQSMIMLGVQMAVQAFSIGFTTGESLSAGLMASPVGWIILGLGLLIGGIFKFIGSHKKDAVDLAKAAKEAEKSLKEAQNHTTQEAQNHKSTADEMKKLKEEYDDFQKKIHLTAEEEERKKELYDEIVEKYPELVTYYDKENELLTIGNQLWEDRVKSEEEAAKIAKATNLALSANGVLQKKLALAQSNDARIRTSTEYGDKVKTAEAAKKVFSEGLTIRVDGYDRATSDLKGIQDWYKNNEDWIEDMKTNIHLDNLQSVTYHTTASGGTYGIRGSGNADLLKDILKDYLDEDMQNRFADFIDADHTSNDADTNPYTMLTLDELGKIDEALEKYLADINEEVNGIGDEQKRQASLKNQNQLQHIYAENYKLDHEDASDAEAEVAGAFVAQAAKAYEDFTYQNIVAWTEDSNHGKNGMSNTSAYGIDTITWDELKAGDREDSENQVFQIKKVDGGIAEVHFTDAEIAAEWEALGLKEEDWNNANSEAERMGKVLPSLLQKKLEAGEIEGMTTFADLDKDVQKKLTDLYGNIILQNGSQAAITALTDFTETIDGIDGEALAYDFIEARNAINDSLTHYGFNKNQFNTYGNDILQGMIDNIDKGLKNGLDPEGIRRTYQAMLSGLSEEESKDMMQMLNAMDFSNITLGNINEQKNMWIQNFKQMKKERGEIISTEEAEAEWEKFFNIGKQQGAIGIKINSVSGLEDIESGLSDFFGGIAESADKVASILSDYKDNGFINFSQYKELGEELDKVGLSVKDFTTATEEGFQVDIDALQQAYQDQINDKDYLIEQTKDAIDQGIEELDNQINILKSLQAQINANKDLLTLEQQRSKVSKATAYNALIQAKQYDAAKELMDNNNWTEIEVNTTDFTDTIDDLTERKTKLWNIRNDENALRQYAGGAQANATSKEISRTFAGITSDVTSAKDAFEKMTDAAEKAADAYDDMIEKQEALNEKIKEYNELLYGKENRKSSLDVLYNYTEAINSFNDEISRSKELLEDSKSLEESTAALTRYTQATHNLLVEEKAKQEVLKKGLANYEDIIESGTSYTDELTGNKIDVDFSEYVKKDARTNKYIIDQRLLDEAKFADTWKDYLEQQVSDYNKYSEELLKSEDEVRKKEKELEDERNSARKSYVAMEKEIADALKQQYQNEVDALQSKYDSMKDADDDYLDALQEAIDKQRQLRDQENAYEDLAKQEKKLSLMQRDTSGANALEVQNLEEDIQQSREDLLDEAIDNVIDGLSKLYESQEELRNEEMELKQALLDNTLYWNQQAENLAGSFENADEYAAYLSSISKEYADMTLTMQQDKLAEYGDTYTQATEYMAMISMDSASETHDFINDTVTTTGEEVEQVVAETAETFSTEVVRAYNETTEAFKQDMQKAKNAIDDANKALDDAIKKYNECAQAANEAADAYNKLMSQQGYGSGGGDNDEKDDQNNSEFEPDHLYAGLNKGGVDHNALDSIGKQGFSEEEEKEAMLRAAYGKMSWRSMSATEIKDFFNAAYGTSYEGMKKAFDAMGIGDKGFGQVASWLISDLSYDPNNDGTPAYYYKRLKSAYAFAEGGLVNFTGPAWVDGQPDRPEAFLSAEDTENIGNAAKILADIPWLDRTTSNGQVITNNGGDVSVEINLNIDHISSETDIDEMLERVKEEIVEVARPAGTNTILQQEI